jgi:hypothetical protein
MKKGIVIPLPVPIRCHQCSGKVPNGGRIVFCACCYRAYCERCVASLRRFYMENSDRVEAALLRGKGRCMEGFFIAVGLIALEDLRKSYPLLPGDEED